MNGALLVVGFFVMVLLWPGALLIERLYGVRAGLAASVVSCGLMLTQAVLPAPQLHGESIWLERPFESEQQMARHTIRLPLEDPVWRAAWSATTEPHAYVYVALRLADGVQDPAVLVLLRDRPLGALTPAARIRPDSPWFRIRLPREEIERDALLPLTVAPRPDAPPAAGAVALHGGYSYRPTFPAKPSAFFDGARWLDEAHSLFPDYTPRGRGPARFYIELRLIEPHSRRVLATYY